MAKRWLIVLALGTLLFPILTACGRPASKRPAEIRLDYAYYNPSSLVLRKFG